MKKILSLLLLCSLLLGLSGCNKSETPAGPNEPNKPAKTEPIRLDELNIEFVADGRDPEELLTLKKEFPALLTAALKEEQVEVGSISVTFGTSAEATAEALGAGSVQLAWLPLETYLRSTGRTQAIAVQWANEDETMRLSMPLNDVNGPLRAQAPSGMGLWPFTAQELEAACWALPADDEVIAYYTAQILAEKEADFGKLTNLHYYTDETDFYDDADFILRRGVEDEYLYLDLTVVQLAGSVIAVSGSIADNARLCTALARTLTTLDADALSALAVYADAAVYGISEEDFAEQRRAFGL